MDFEVPDRPLRIGLVSYRSAPHCGGQGVYIRHLSRALSNLGHQVTVITGPPAPILDPILGRNLAPTLNRKLAPTLNRPLPVEKIENLDLYNPEDPFRVPSVRELLDPINLLEWIGVSTQGFPEPFTFGIRAYRFLRRRLSHFDILHDNQSLSYGIAALCRIAPTIATIHHPITRDRAIAIGSAEGFMEKLKQARWFSFLGMQKRSSRVFSRILTVSESAKKDIAADFNIPESRFRVVPNGIDLDRFHPMSGIEREENRLIVTNSADVPLKGLSHLLIALKKVSGKRDVKLTVVGTPKKNSAITRQIQALGIGDRVEFTGRIDDDTFVRAYARSAIAVVPSVYEGFGLPAGEAMACAVPVISTTGGALPEVVGDAGILVPPRNPDALAKAITDLLDHPEKGRILGSAGLRRVREHFTWEKAGEKTLSAYREVMAEYYADHRF